MKKITLRSKALPLVTVTITGLLFGFTAARPVYGEPEVPAKHYHCVMFIVDHLVDTAPFTITGKGTYTDSKGVSGTYTFDSASSTLTFHGGNLDGQRAQYDAKTKHIHILGPSGRRVIECD